MPYRTPAPPAERVVYEMPLSTFLIKLLAYLFAMLWLFDWIDRHCGRPWTAVCAVGLLVLAVLLAERDRQLDPPENVCVECNQRCGSDS